MHEWILTSALVLAQLRLPAPLTSPTTAAEKAKHSVEDLADRKWVTWVYVAQQARSLTRADVAAVILTGWDVGCCNPQDRIVIEDQEVIDNLKSAADNAQRADEELAYPGVSWADEISFMPTERKINQEARNGTPQLVSLQFNPRWEATSFGPEFRKAFGVYESWYIANIRFGLARLVSAKRPVKANVDYILLDYVSGNYTDLDQPKMIAEFCRAASTADASVYDVTDKDRYPVTVRIYKNGHFTSLYLLLPGEESKLKGAFAHLVYKYVLRDAGYRRKPEVKQPKAVGSPEGR